MPIRVTTAEECDARDDDSSNEVGIKKKVRQFSMHPINILTKTIDIYLYPEQIC